MTPRRAWLCAGAVALAAAGVAASVGSVAQAAVQTTVVAGEVVRIESRLDTAQAAEMTEGVPVSWDLEVSATRPDGVIDLGLDATVPDDAFDVTVRSCEAAWTDAGCPTGERMLAAGPADTALAFARQSAADPGRYRVDVVLARAAPGATATLTFRAAGTGTAGPPSPSGTLPATGVGVAPLVLPAVLAIAVGLAIAGAASWRRRRA
jgi:hypothetical protein